VVRVGIVSGEWSNVAAAGRQAAVATPARSGMTRIETGDRKFLLAAGRNDLYCKLFLLQELAA
jgi:hypothetical protein